MFEGIPRPHGGVKEMLDKYIKESGTRKSIRKAATSRNEANFAPWLEYLVISPRFDASAFAVPTVLPRCLEFPDCNDSSQLQFCDVMSSLLDIFTT